MSLGIFDIFTNDSAQRAADANRQLSLDNANTARGIYSNYGATSLADIGRGTDNAAATINSGVANARADTNSAIGAYAPLSGLGAKYGGATSLYLDALGVNGAAGSDRAKGAFTTGPGYQFAVDQALRGVENSGAAKGGALSGNALAALNDRASGMASQEYGSYLDRLGGFVNPELQATSGAATGIAGGYNKLADIGMTGAGAVAGIYGKDAENRVGIAGNVASGVAGANRDSTTGQMAANNAEATAAQQGSTTFWNGLTNLGAAAARAAFPAPRLPA
jgi:hypothetical protein